MQVVIEILTKNSHLQLEILVKIWRLVEIS